MEKITFITCGGTIDKDYATSKGSYYFIIGEPKIKDILNKVRLNREIDIISVLAKDSIDIDKVDRKLILEAVKSTQSKNIIITHGTDTMIDTAKVLSEVEDKIIILVGSSLPYIFRNSDAEFNVGFAIGSLNTLNELGKKGVYITMNGELFDINNVEKTQEGVFRKIK